MATKERVSSDVFIRAYQAATSHAEVAEALGLKLPSVIARATQYRAKGIALKQMPRKSHRLDVAAAQALVNQLTADSKVG
jgi:hypothetical protein